MRKASLKCEMNYYQGKRIALSDAVDIVITLTFNKEYDAKTTFLIEQIKASLRDEYKRNLAKEKELYSVIFGEQRQHEDYIYMTRPYEEEE